MENIVLFYEDWTSKIQLSLKFTRRKIYEVMRKLYLDLFEKNITLKYIFGAVCYSRNKESLDIFY